MKTLATPFIQKTTLVSLFTDITAMAFIYLVPSISHLLSFPVYLIEPMRLMLILAMVHTSRKNAYLLAFTLPLFSLLISGHPVLPKMLLIMLELTLNVFLFYILLKKVKYVFPAILFSIMISKILYYFLKFILIQVAVINTEIFSTPILIQVITTFVFSIYLYFFYSPTQPGGR
ncbi:MAG: hypothetical protein NTW16_13315 [Bacteroidetes bacterium]|nr:hypothetical protein [Bacteroidota bacterium]